MANKYGRRGADNRALTADDLIGFAGKAIGSDRRKRKSHDSMSAVFSMEGKEYFLKEVAVEQLLRAGEFVVFFQELKDDEYRQNNSAMTPTLLCSDVFAWGCADAEDIESEDELKALYLAVRSEPSWGSIKWVCKKRNEQPQMPIVKDMKKAGAWDTDMQALPENLYDKARKEKQ